MEQEEKTISFVYKKIYEKTNEQNELIVDIEYSSKTKLSIQGVSQKRSELKSYFDDVFNSKTEGIIDIVSSIREMTKDLEERKLNVRLYRIDSGEYVQYKNGLIEVCGAYKEEWDDNQLLVYTDQKGTEVKFKREGFHLTNKRRITSINKELANLYNIVITLNNMNKIINEEKPKVLKIIPPRKN